MPAKPIRILGSVRDGNMTGKALALVLDQLRKDDEVTVDFADPAELQLAQPGHTPTEDAMRLRERVTAATGIVLATPEYHGSYSSVMKLVIENLGFPSTLAGKPISLLGVAAGSIGAIKALEHLRSVTSHIGAMPLPSTVSVANVRTVFDENGNCKDPKIEKRIRGVATTLLDYIRQTICPRVALEAMVRENEA
jgi:chromate reductase, NAD(P)H dehydrogenase (quinone)